MEKEITQKLIRGIISIILSIITIAVHIDIIKTALQIERTPPVYLLQIYTVVLAIGIISYLVYYAISQGVDVYRIIEEHKKYMRWIERTASMKREYNKTTAELGKPLPNPIDNTIEEVNQSKADRDISGNPYLLQSELIQ